MYVPEQFEETRTAVLHDLIESHSFATLITLSAAASGMAPEVNHVPMLVDRAAGDLGTLRGHVARANPVWRTLIDGCRAIAVFQGPAGYVSPSWYPSKKAHRKVVPTWNYAIVHAHGSARCIEDEQWLCKHVSELTAKHEAVQDEPWKITDAPSEFIDTMLANIVGIELPITSIVGKWKVSQNRSVEDRRGVESGLRSAGDDNALAMADLIARQFEQTPRRP